MSSQNKNSVTTQNNSKNSNTSTLLPKPKISAVNLISLITLLIVGFVIYHNIGDIKTTLSHLKDTNLLIFFFLLPEQALMLFSGGKIFFSFLDHKTLKKQLLKSAPSLHKTTQPIFSENHQNPSPLTISRITLESNFVKQAFPSAGIVGATYLTWRLKPFGFSAPQTSFLVLLRYFAIVCFNQIQTLVAIVFILIFRPPSAAGRAILSFAFLLVIGVIIMLIGAILLVSSKRRSIWFAQKFVSLANFFAKIFTFGKKRKVLDSQKTEIFLSELHDTYLYAKKNLNTLKQPILWGAVYSFLEIGSYWVVASSLGHPELLPEIMIGEAIGSIAGAVIPYGTYELSMAGAMASLGVDLGLAGLIVIITRIFFLGENFVFGYICYQHSITTLTKIYPFVQK